METQISPEQIEFIVKSSNNDIIEEIHETSTFSKSSDNLFNIEESLSPSEYFVMTTESPIIIPDYTNPHSQYYVDPRVSSTRMRFAFGSSSSAKFNGFPADLSIPSELCIYIKKYDFIYPENRKSYIENDIFAKLGDVQLVFNELYTPNIVANSIPFNLIWNLDGYEIRGDHVFIPLNFNKFMNPLNLHSFQHPLKLIISHSKDFPVENLEISLISKNYYVYNATYKDYLKSYAAHRTTNFISYDRFNYINTVNKSNIVKYDEYITKASFNSFGTFGIFLLCNNIDDIKVLSISIQDDDSHLMGDTYDYLITSSNINKYRHNGSNKLLYFPKHISDSSKFDGIELKNIKCADKRTRNNVKIIVQWNTSDSDDSHDLTVYSIEPNLFRYMPEGVVINFVV